MTPVLFTSLTVSAVLKPPARTIVWSFFSRVGAFMVRLSLTKAEVQLCWQNLSGRVSNLELHEHH